MTLDKRFGSAQKSTIGKISRIKPKENWAIKDSYETLDLEEDGFVELFQSQ